MARINHQVDVTVRYQTFDSAPFRIGRCPVYAADKGRVNQKPAQKLAAIRAMTTKVKSAVKPGGNAATTKDRSKQSQLIDLLRRKTGATIDEAVKATGWQPHSIRGAISGLLKKKLGLAVVSEKLDGRGRVYRIVG